MRKGCDFLVNFTMNKTPLIRVEYSLERNAHKDLIFNPNYMSWVEKLNFF